MTHTSFREKESFLAELQRSNDKMKSLLGRIQVALSEQGYPLKKDTYHFLTRVLEPHTRVERTLYMLLFYAAYQSELLSSGSAYLTVRFANEFIEELLKSPELLTSNEVQLMESFERIIESYKEQIRSNLCSITEDGLKAELGKVCDDPLLSQAIWEAISVSGLEGKIHVEDGTLSNYVVEQKSGYYFDVLKPFKFMLPSNGVWEVSNAKVMLVDGILERVSELDKVLNKAMSTKIPLLLIAHGFSEEIISTIKVNVDYKNFDIMPVRLAPDLESLNVINDIAVVSGGDIVSTLKGQMVCFTDFDTLPVVEKVRLSSKELCIENAKTRKAVSEHLRMLLEKRQSNQQVSDLADLVDKRIQGLISASVVLRLPNMTPAQRDSTKVKIDISLRTAKTLLSYGKVDFGTLSLNGSNEPLSKPFNTALKRVQEEIKDLPALSAFAGVYFVGKTILSLMTSGGLVEIEL
jgi:chaperonin GroEL